MTTMTHSPACLLLPLNLSRGTPTLGCSFPRTGVLLRAFLTSVGLGPLASARWSQLRVRGSAISFFSFVFVHRSLRLGISASRRWFFTWHDHCLVLRRVTSASWSGVGVPLPPSLCRWLADLASPRVGARSLSHGPVSAPQLPVLGSVPILPVLGSVPMWRVSTLTSPSRRHQTSLCASSHAFLSRASSGPSWHLCAARGSHMPTLSS